MNTVLDTVGRVSAVCIATAGALFVAVQINHPPLDLDLVGTGEFVVRQSMKTAMTVLALVGLTGLYLRQARATGRLGLVGYLVFATGYLAMFAVEVMATFVLPALEATAPGFVQDVLTAAAGGTPEGDIGATQLLLNLAGVGYMLGGLLFGIALYRAGVLARWACALLAVGTASTALLAVLPGSFNRPAAVPTGIALVALGWSAWRTQLAEPPAARSLVAEPAVR